MPDATCVSCGALFTPTNANMKNCSKRCRERSRDRQPDRMNRPFRGWRVIRCSWCDHEHRTRNPVTRCCSRACAEHLASVTTVCSIPWAQCTCGEYHIARKAKVHCLKPYIDKRRWRATHIEYGSCARCSVTFVRRRGQVGAHCSMSCSRATRKRNRKHILRTSNPTGDRITLKALGDRDGWRCHLCHKPVTKTPGNKPTSPSIDHLIPVSQHGTHTWSNVGLAHRRCNWQRGAHGAAQLRLTA